MRLNTHDPFWVVNDPGPESELADVCFRCTLTELVLQIKAGFGLKENPAIFTVEEEGRTEAKKRLMAREVARAVRDGFLEGEPGLVRQVTLKDEKGRVVLGAKVGTGR